MIYLQATVDNSWPHQPFVGYVTASLVILCMAISVVWPLVMSFTNAKSLRNTKPVDFKLSSALPERSSTGSVVQAQFISFLNDNIARKWFQEFLIFEFAVENILFWTEVQDFKAITNQDLLIQMAKDIYEKYIVEGGPFQINLSADTMTRTKTAVAGEVDSTAFDYAEHDIMVLMKGDAYLRFQRSIYCTKMIQEMNQQIP